ncbi:hypothetical protein PCE1_001105 [Barthelona sp. PCE]
MAKSNTIKRPRSAYLYFCQERRPILREENPDLKMTDISKLLGADWRKLDDTQKIPFNELAAQDKVRYNEEKEAYMVSHPEEVEEVEKPKKKRGAKKKKDPNAPKRPISAYLRFASEIRPAVKEENPSLTFGEITKEVSKRWNELEDEDKVPYKEMFDADKVRYQAQMEEYNKKKELEGEDSDEE